MAEPDEPFRQMEKQVLLLFESRADNYEMKKQACMLSIGGNTITRADLVGVYKEGPNRLPILVECKALARNVCQSSCKVLEYDLRNHDLPIGLIITQTGGLQPGAENVRLDHPNILHFSVSELRDALASRSLDDRICLQAMDPVTCRTYTSATPISTAYIMFEKIADNVHALAPEAASSFAFRVSSQLIRAQCYIFALNLGRPSLRQGVGELELLKRSLDPPVYDFLSARMGLFLHLALTDAWTAAENLVPVLGLQGRRRSTMAHGEWRFWGHASLQRSFRSLKVLNAVLVGEGEAPLFEHGGLNDAIAALGCLTSGTTRDLVARRLFELMTLSCSENWKTIAAHVARHYVPFREYMIKQGWGWPTLLERAFSTTIGSVEAKMIGRYNIAYAGSLTVVNPKTKEVYQPELVDEIYATELDPSRREVLDAFGLRIGKRNLLRFRATLERKSQDHRQQRLQEFHKFLIKLHFPAARSWSFPGSLTREI